MNFKKGATLVEILVVIAIISILLMVVILDFPKMQRKYLLTRAVQKFAQDARRAEDLALSGYKYKDQQGQVWEVWGYGIFIDKQNLLDYKIYADLKNSGIRGRYDAQDKIVEDVDLSKEAPGIGFSSSFFYMTGNVADINFAPPNPDVQIFNLSEGETRGGVILQVLSEKNYPESRKYIYIHKSGLIQIQ